MMTIKDSRVIDATARFVVGTVCHFLESWQRVGEATARVHAGVRDRIGALRLRVLRH